ncbi:hypothetical protein G6F65_020745 [Rhizopus arrhizus]|nr:hypothetical protein G6F65_020745 [Rhizopus arrhizus]
MRVVECLQASHVAGHQRGRGELADLGDGQLFGMVTDGRAAVEHAGALRLGIFEQVRGIHVFHVERRVFAHDDCPEVRQRQILGGGFRPPVMAVQVGVGHQRDRRGDGLDDARLDVKVALHGHAERMAARHQVTHHGDRTVLVRL